MKTIHQWNFKSIAGKVMLGFVLITMIGSIDVTQAIAKDYNKSKGKHDNGRYENRGHRDYRGHTQRMPERRPYGHYGHRERVYYPPPPVFYAPPPPPGIRIFFPPIYIHP